MIPGQWLLIDTLARPETWSVLAVDTTPRPWKSLARMVPARLLPIVAAAHATRTAVERQLPKSRHAWSLLRARAIPVVAPDDCVHGVRFWVGAGDPPVPPRVAAFLIDGESRTLVRAPGLGPAFEQGRSVWVGAETFDNVERFDGALDLITIVARAEPGSRWAGTFSVRTRDGLRSLLLATRTSTADPARWRGLLADVTESVPPLGKTFEATTVDTLCAANPGRHLALVDTERIRLIRWVSNPIPGLRWSGGIDERTLPHPEDHPRIRHARTEILAGKSYHTIPGLRLAATDGGWLIADAEAAPLPYGPLDGSPPRFALVRFDLRPADRIPGEATGPGADPSPERRGAAQGSSNGSDTPA
jgi:hypothetical protein